MVCRPAPAASGFATSAGGTARQPLDIIPLDHSSECL